MNIRALLGDVDQVGLGGSVAR